jgi:hypothetical protein
MSAASETSGMPECVAATATSLRSFAYLDPPRRAGALTITVGRVWTMMRRIASAKS